MREPIKETDLAKRVIAWLEDQRWDVYQEVQPAPGGETADIVAVQGPLLWVIECKTSCGIAVIDQAYRWTRSSANMISIAVPISSWIAQEICRRLGIGIISTGRYHDSRIMMPERGKLFRRSSFAFRSKLKPEHKTFAMAGNPDGRRWTPFQQTCSEVLRVATAHPDGITLKDLIASIETHYASAVSARTCLRKWIEAGAVKGVRLERDGKALKVVPC